MVSLFRDHGHEWVGSAPFRLIPIRLITLYWRKYSKTDLNPIPNPIPNTIPNPNPDPNPIPNPNI